MQRRMTMANSWYGWVSLGQQMDQTDRRAFKGTIKLVDIVSHSRLLSAIYDSGSWHDPIIVISPTSHFDESPIYPKNRDRHVRAFALLLERFARASQPASQRTLNFLASTSCPDNDRDCAPSQMILTRSAHRIDEFYSPYVCNDYAKRKIKIEKQKEIFFFFLNFFYKFSFFFFFDQKTFYDVIWQKLRKNLVTSSPSLPNTLRVDPKNLR